jgi:single-stranded-DNA-specific exonuclease
VPKLHIDTAIRFSEISLDLLDSYELLRPFGANNPQPLFMSTGVRFAGEPRVIKEKHLKFRFEQDGVIHEAIYFNGAGTDLPKPPWDIAFMIDRNEFRGRTQVNIVLQAVRKS